MQRSMLRQIAGDDLDLITLVGPADDHHTYQPSDAQVSEVMRADVYFRLGVPFESGPGLPRSATPDCESSTCDMASSVRHGSPCPPRC